eukprot:Sspe_Gene.9197::Locus_3100_Transcript_2_2_Confidence_0.286_Length_3271::g.9197::m.9197/K05857/PLCD; phosphatidylinositol phospholipase C, delta
MPCFPFRRKATWEKVITAQVPAVLLPLIEDLCEKEGADEGCEGVWHFGADLRESFCVAKAQDVLFPEIEGSSLGLEWGAGLTVASVVPGSAAARCGAEEYVGWTLVAVDGRPVLTTAQLTEALQGVRRASLRFAAVSDACSAFTQPTDKSRQVPLMLLWNGVMSDLVEATDPPKGFPAQWQSTDKGFFLHRMAKGLAVSRYSDSFFAVRVPSESADAPGLPLAEKRERELRRVAHVSETRRRVVAFGAACSTGYGVEHSDVVRALRSVKHPLLEMLLDTTPAEAYASPPEPYHLICSWIHCDRDASGTVSKAELRKINIHEGQSLPESVAAYLQNDGELTFAEFTRILRDLTQVKAAADLFSVYSMGQPMMDKSGLCRFLREEQGVDDSEQTCVEVVSSALGRSTPGSLSVEDFTAYLHSPANSAWDISKGTKVYHDMNQPLHHYFIASSHNTYLKGHQLWGESSAEMYTEVLRSGCRCVEIDCWDGDQGEPVVYHGYTRTTKVLFSDVLRAIAADAFALSPYPVILSLEVHASAEQQKKMAGHLTSILGDLLYLPARWPTAFTPEALQRRILLKAPASNDGGWDLPQSSALPAESKFDRADELPQEAAMRKSKRAPLEPSLSRLISLPSIRLDSMGDLDCVRPYHVMSFSEGAIGKAAAAPHEMKALTSRMIGRVYPNGTRVSSENFDPLPALSLGCQLVSLNYQKEGSCELALYQSVFRDNGGCGYLLKPLCLRGGSPEFGDPGVVRVRVLSIAGLTKLLKRWNNIEPYVAVELAGVLGDPCGQRLRTPTVPANRHAHSWDTGTDMVFSTSSTAMAVVKFQLWDDTLLSDTLLSEAAIPWHGLLPGVRSVRFPVTDVVLLIRIEHLEAAKRAKEVMTPMSDRDDSPVIGSFAAPTDADAAPARKSLPPDDTMPAYPPSKAISPPPPHDSEGSALMPEFQVGETVQVQVFSPTAPPIWSFCLVSGRRGDLYDVLALRSPGTESFTGCLLTDVPLERLRKPPRGAPHQKGLTEDPRVQLLTHGLLAFYAKHCPAKEEKALELAVKHVGDEASLLFKLEQAYPYAAGEDL